MKPVLAADGHGAGDHLRVAAGLRLGCTFVPLNIIALSTLPRHSLTTGHGVRSLMAQSRAAARPHDSGPTLAPNTQVGSLRLVEAAAGPSARACAYLGRRRRLTPSGSRRSRRGTRQPHAPTSSFQSGLCYRARVGAAAAAVARGDRRRRRPSRSSAPLDADG